ncbi:MAG: hypothetical protein Ta2F_08780 [Termitinemataceae bacterium]|nr:MAG: hypothetical protein Ta2F_08780 [Termitinemataceae bacterium]
MESAKKPSIFSDRREIGNADELDEYGVWVKSEPEDYITTSTTLANSNEKLGENPTEDKSDSFNADYELDSLPDFDFTEGAVGENAADTFKNDELPAETNENTAKAAAEISTELLLKIANELSTIKSEIKMLKSEFSAISASKNAGAGALDEPKEDHAAQIAEEKSQAQQTLSGFFEDDGDETIALTNDELNNVLGAVKMEQKTESAESNTDFDDSMFDVSVEADEIGAEHQPPSDIDLDLSVDVKAEDTQSDTGVQFDIQQQEEIMLDVDGTSESVPEIEDKTEAESSDFDLNIDLDIPAEESTPSEEEPVAEDSAPDISIDVGAQGESADTSDEALSDNDLNDIFKNADIIETTEDTISQEQAEDHSIEEQSIEDEIITDQIITDQPIIDTEAPEPPETTEDSVADPMPPSDDPISDNLAITDDPMPPSDDPVSGDLAITDDPMPPSDDPVSADLAITDDPMPPSDDPLSDDLAITDDPMPPSDDPLSDDLAITDDPMPPSDDPVSADLAITDDPMPDETQNIDLDLSDEESEPESKADENDDLSWGEIAGGIPEEEKTEISVPDLSPEDKAAFDAAGDFSESLSGNELDSILNNADINTEVTPGTKEAEESAEPQALAEQESVPPLADSTPPPLTEEIDPALAPAIAMDNSVNNNVPEEKTSTESGIPTGEFKKELQTVLSYMDQLLEALPESKIEEFARSEQFEIYKKVFKDLGLI